MFLVDRMENGGMPLLLFHVIEMILLSVERLEEKVQVMHMCIAEIVALQQILRFMYIMPLG
jgi:hypothetical protein